MMRRIRCLVITTNLTWCVREVRPIKVQYQSGNRIFNRYNIRLYFNDEFYKNYLNGIPKMEFKLQVIRFSIFRGDLCIYDSLVGQKMIRKPSATMVFCCLFRLE